MKHPDTNYEIGKASDLQKKYGLYAENAPHIKLDLSKVPVELQKVIRAVQC